MTITNQRPGVYSSYTFTSAYGSPRSAMAAAVVTEGASSLAGLALSFTGYQAAAEALSGSDENAVLLECVRLLFAGGVSRVIVSAVSDDGYADALALIQEEDGIGAIVCGARDNDSLDALKASVRKSCDNMRERIAFVGCAQAAQALDAAERLNSERLVVCCPAAATGVYPLANPLFSAAAMAGMILSANDPAYNWNGAALETLTACGKLAEDDIQSLIASGVTVLEERGGVRCIRPVTTKTRSNGETDYSLRPLNAILIVDAVVGSVREALRARLSGARLTPAAIATQIMIELAANRDDGLIESFEEPAVITSAEDPSVCVAEMAFKIAHVLSQIHISAFIKL